MGLKAVSLALMAVVALLAFALGYIIRFYQDKARVSSAQEKARRILEDAEKKAKETILAAKDEALKMRAQLDEDFKRRRLQLQRQEERLQRRQERLDRKAESLDKREKRLSQRQSELQALRNELEELKRKELEELARIAQMSPEEAKELLLERVREEARNEMAKVIREEEARAKAEAERRAREIIASAMQRLASEEVAEVAVTTVPLPSDEMKGRIIGRGGRNIRTIENVLGVDLVVDDTPEAVTISCFDPIRREIARVALTKLIMDGRIHPGRIEQAAEQARREVEEIIKEEGEKAVYKLGLTGLPEELINLVGQLKFRTSYGQNVLLHSIETARLAGMMAAELGANVTVAKLGGLLHDIGKAVDHSVDGPHAAIGAEIAKRYGLPDIVVNCIAAHHGEVEPQSVEAVLVEVADAVSGGRPGARRESLESYLKRIETLENLAASFPGVSQVFAIQAGREIRVIVKPEEMDDLAIIQLSKDIARKIEESLEYPGQIKVTVIRETRAVDYAK
ncbi:MAG TPA: ribonuclease Y [Chloroflexi bacterium]|nr:ribonuclease Y [Chloroflexota bacterium]